MPKELDDADFLEKFAQGLYKNNVPDVGAWSRFRSIQRRLRLLDTAPGQPEQTAAVPEPRRFQESHPDTMIGKYNAPRVDAPQIAPDLTTVDVGFNWPEEVRQKMDLPELDKLYVGIKVQLSAPVGALGALEYKIYRVVDIDGAFVTFVRL